MKSARFNLDLLGRWFRRSLSPTLLSFLPLLVILVSIVEEVVHAGVNGRLSRFFLKLFLSLSICSLLNLFFFFSAVSGGVSVCSLEQLPECT